MCGLKYKYRDLFELEGVSHPAWGEWIEIGEHRVLPAFVMSRPARGEWIEMSIATDSLR